MALTSTNFIAGKMNKSVDERLIPPGEYIDALNVRLGSTENTEIGAVENSLGNTLLTQLEFNGVPLQGDIRTIGVYEDGINETLYWFVHNENNPNSITTGVVDMVVSYNTNLGSLTYHVVSTSVLNFSFTYLITGISKIENLLFFTDDLNPPRVINVTSDYAYPGPGAIDDVLEEEDVSVIVKPPGYEDFDTAAGQIAPLGAPYVKPRVIPGEENYMETRFLCFAYRYRYQDGQYSATSLFSEPVFQPSAFALSIQNFWNEGMKNRYNGADVHFSTGSKRVKEVDLLYKQSTSNVIYVIKRYNKQELGWSDNEFKQITFTNSEIYTTLGSDELLRLYDNVPRTAKAQTIQGNRLMYGNYVDGYDIRYSEGGAKIPIVYTLEGLSGEIAGTNLPDPVSSNGVYDFDGIHNEPDSVLTFDLSDLNPSGGGNIQEGLIIQFGITMQQTTATVCTDSGGSTFCPGGAALQSSPFTLPFSFTVPPGGYADVNAMLSSQAFKDRIGGSVAQGFAGLNVVKPLYPCYESGQGATLSDKFYQQSDNPISTTGLVMVSGGIGGIPEAPTQLCSLTALDTNPFPSPCSTTILLSGITDCDPSTTPCGTITPGPPATGNMVQNGFDFGAVVPALVGGEIVIDQLTGLSASIAVAPVAGDNFLQLQDIDGGINTLVGNTGVGYQIVSGGAVTNPICFPDGFAYTNTGNSFSIQAPCIQYYQADGTNSGVFSHAIRYFNFLSFSSTASYLQDANSGSLHSNRDYEVGIVYMDEYGRSSTVLTSQKPTVFFDPSTCIYKNQIQVTLENLPPYWARKYKFVIKPSQGTYETIYSNLFYVQDGTAEATGAGLPVADANDPSQVWFRLEGQNQNILKTGDELIVKQDSQGSVVTGAKAVVLDIQSYSGKGITDKSLSGLYMLLKPSGWTIESIENSTYFYPEICRKNESGSSISGACISNYSLNDASGVPYTIPVGSTIRIKGRSWRGGTNAAASINYDRTFTASQDYNTFHQWAVGDDLASKMTTNGTGTSNNNGMSISFDNTLYTSSGAACATSEYAVKCSIVQNAAGGQFFVWSGALTEEFEASWSDSGWFPGRACLKIEVTRTGGVFVFETVPGDADPNLFYDASELLDIEPDPADPNGQQYHMAARRFDPDGNGGLGAYSIAPNSQDQTAAGDNMITMLDFYNCYVFGNGVESYKIYDSPAGKSFQLGERTLAVSNQDFQEADRFAGMTYSGVYSSSANSNNLNEFNLGLLNFKDCETTFGPIQVLYARETDILVLQEDRISYVLASKNVITDSTGGGAIASVPQVLGTQIARIEEYGISFNPESFTSWGYDMFFTDTKRGAVINLRGASKGNDQLQVVSSYGMNSWFRDCFNTQLTTQKLGAYDPYMKEYVLGTNLIQVPTPVNEIPCGTTISQFNSSQSITYEVDLGEVIGTVDVPYNISPGGQVTITVDWNGDVTTVTANSNGSLSFDKLYNTPQTCTVTLTPLVPSTYDVTVECPPEVPLTVIQVVVNSSNYNGQTITTNYNWNDISTISPYTGISPSNLTNFIPAEYEVNVGVRSVGVFPYDGADISLRTQKLATDTFDFNPSLHKFRILSSNTLYNNNAADIQNLLLASSVVSGPITSPNPGEYKATEPAFNMPLGNQYLYLIWDLRLISSGNLCYCSNPSTEEEVCCQCEVQCDTVYLGPVTNTSAQACQTSVSSPGSQGQVGFQGSGGLPVTGNIVFANSTCLLSAGYPPPGFYVVDPSSTTTLTPKRWIQLGPNGVVIGEGSC